MENFGRFGPLLGVISVGSIYCKFLVYAARNAEVLICHEIKLKQLSPSPGLLEFNPIEIWKNVAECIEVASRNLIILDINPLDIVAVGISNQRGTTVLWKRSTGAPLYNALAWSDNRTASTLKDILITVKNRKNYLKSVCGLPLSTCSSALKIKWLKDNVPAVSQSILEKDCLFGSLDTWILWNLTGGLDAGVHLTDVTNAAYTMLLNLQTVEWDKKLCNFFKVPEHLLPNIKPSSEIFGYIHEGPLHGIPIAGCMGDQPAALLGHLCTQAKEAVCTIDESCFILFNTGQEIIDSNNGLLSTIAYKLGPNEKTYYALEGAVANAGSSVSWLKDKLQINTEINKNESTAELLSNILAESTMMSSTGSLSFPNSSSANEYRKSEVLFVPAFSGLYSPYWKHDVRGILLGITNHTTAENIAQAAYDATGFQIHDVLDAFIKDTPTWLPPKKIIVGGEFSENNHLMQTIADITGLVIERPQMTSSSCLGVMLAAGICMKALNLDNARVQYSPPCDTFFPTTTVNRREILYSRWNYAVEKCINWDNFEKYDKEMELFTKKEVDANYTIRRSIPGTIFAITTFTLIIISKILQNSESM